MKKPKTYREAIARIEMLEHNICEMRKLHHDLLDRVLPRDKAFAAAEPVEVDMPPDEVMAAMKAISPTMDKTYEANWAFWERNKERAKLHPEAFADEIVRGAVWEPMVEPRTEILIIPETVTVT